MAIGLLRSTVNPLIYVYLKSLFIPYCSSSVLSIKMTFDQFPNLTAEMYQSAVTNRCLLSSSTNLIVHSSLHTVYFETVSILCTLTIL